MRISTKRIYIYQQYIRITVTKKQIYHYWRFRFKFLTDTIGLTRDDAISIKQKLLEHWQLNFEHNSTIKDENKNKKILKEDFTWPIVAFLVDGNFPDIDDCLSFLPDQSIKKRLNAS